MSKADLEKACMCSHSDLGNSKGSNHESTHSMPHSDWLHHESQHPYKNLGTLKLQLTFAGPTVTGHSNTTECSQSNYHTTAASLGIL